MSRLRFRTPSNSLISVVAAALSASSLAPMQSASSSFLNRQPGLRSQHAPFNTRAAKARSSRERERLSCWRDENRENAETDPIAKKNKHCHHTATTQQTVPTHKSVGSISTPSSGGSFQ